MHKSHTKKILFLRFISTVLLSGILSIFSPQLLAWSSVSSVLLSAGITTQASVSSEGVQSNSYNYNSMINSNGRYILFISSADNLVAGDTNQSSDVFLRDRINMTTERVSLANDGSQPDGDSSSAAMSDDGRYIVFGSTASNLVAGEQTFFSQLYVRDRVNGTTQRISVDSNGVLANGSSSSVAMSHDGRYISFSSFATNLVENDTNGKSDVFIHDRLNSTTERISVSSTGVQGNNRSAGSSISADGEKIAFLSSANNLVANDTNNSLDIFVYNLSSGIIQRVSVNSQGVEGDDSSSGAKISSNGQVVSFTSSARNLVPGDTNNLTDVFVHDLVTGVTERISITSDGIQARDYSFSGGLSADGRYVTFTTFDHAFDIGNVDWWYEDVFLHDRLTKTTEIMSVSTDGIQGNEESGRSLISGDGRFVTFESFAKELISGDNGSYTQDIFIRDRGMQ